MSVLRFGPREHILTALLAIHCGGGSGWAHVKNGVDRYIVLNWIARSVIAECRGFHDRFVFTHDERPQPRMNWLLWAAIAFGNDAADSPSALLRRRLSHSDSAMSSSLEVAHSEITEKPRA